MADNTAPADRPKAPETQERQVYPSPSPEPQTQEEEIKRVSDTLATVTQSIEKIAKGSVAIKTERDDLLAELTEIKSVRDVLYDELSGLRDRFIDLSIRMDNIKAGLVCPVCNAGYAQTKPFKKFLVGSQVTSHMRRMQDEDHMRYKWGDDWEAKL